MLVKKMNFTATRTHDWALVNSGERIIDTHFIFPLINLDPADPTNYYFEPTDKILQRSFDMGLDVLYRIGTSIEHTGDVHYNSNPPYDFNKYAEVLAGTYDTSRMAGQAALQCRSNTGKSGTSRNFRETSAGTTT